MGRTPLSVARCSPQKASRSPAIPDCPLNLSVIGRCRCFLARFLDSTLNKILSWDGWWYGTVARILLSRLVAHENDSAGHSRPSLFSGEHYRTKKCHMHTLLIASVFSAGSWIKSYPGMAGDAVARSNDQLVSG